MNLGQCHNFSDFRTLAKKRLPGPIFHYIDGAADDEITYKRNSQSFNDVDLVNGGWEDRGADAGRNVIYDFENFERRFCVTGGATGWCWLNFREED